MIYISCSWEKSRSMLTADFRLRCDKFNRDANIYSTDVSFDGIKRIDFGADRNEYFNISTTALTGYYVKAILRATLLTETQHHPAGNLCLTTIPIQRRVARYGKPICVWCVPVKCHWGKDNRRDDGEFSSIIKDSF